MRNVWVSQPKDQPTRKFAQLFWDNLAKTGRVNELWLGLSLYFMNGFGEGIKSCDGDAETSVLVCLRPSV